jgi:hypothetical protein
MYISTLHFAAAKTKKGTTNIISQKLVFVLPLSNLKLF